MTLQEWMKANGYRSDAALAEKVGVVTRSQIQRIRKGNGTSLKTACKLAEVTGLPATSFLPESAA